MSDVNGYQTHLRSREMKASWSFLFLCLKIIMTLLCVIQRHYTKCIACILQRRTKLGLLEAGEQNSEIQLKIKKIHLMAEKTRPQDQQVQLQPLNEKLRTEPEKLAEEDHVTTLRKKEHSNCRADGSIAEYSG